MKKALLIGSITLLFSSSLAFAVYQHHHHSASSQQWSDNAKEGWHNRGEDWNRHHLSQTDTTTTTSTGGVTKTKPTKTRPTRAK